MKWMAILLPLAIACCGAAPETQPATAAPTAVPQQAAPSSTTQPATQPTTAPANPAYEGLRGLLAAIPPENRPKPGATWDDDTIALANQWLFENALGHDVITVGKLLESEMAVGGTQQYIMVTINNQFRYDGKSWSSLVWAKFPISAESSLADRKQGADIGYRGTIKSIVISNDGEVIGLTVRLTDCQTVQIVRGGKGKGRK